MIRSTLDLNELAQTIMTEVTDIADVSGIPIVICNEQQFMDKDIYDNTVYITMHFDKAITNNIQTSIKVSLRALGTANDIDTVLNMFTAFVNKYNLTALENSTTNRKYGMQIWAVPNSENNFAEVNEAFRSTVETVGSLIVAPNATYISFVYHGDSGDEDTFLLDLSCNETTSTDSQAFASSGSRVLSVPKFFTASVSVDTYAYKDSQFARDVITCMASKTFSEKNRVFHFTITLYDNISYEFYGMLVHKSLYYKLGNPSTLKADFAEVQ